MDLWYITIIILHLVIIQAQVDECEPVTSQFDADSIEQSALNVKEGLKVILTCPRIVRYNIVYISVANKKKLGKNPVTLIDSSNMTYISNKYSFNQTSDGTYAFTINSITRDDEGSYTCVQGPDSRLRTIKVIYSPSESSPQCSSNYKSPIIFYDEITDDFVFNCSTERGKPPVTTKIYVNDQEVTSDLEIINETRTDTENMLTKCSLFRPLNHTLQNSEFVCNVSQQLPSPYDDYQGSCSFGPLHLLPGFSLSVSPSNVTVREESNVTLTCASNVTGVEITWNNIPSEKYIVSPNYNQSSVLTILLFKPVSSGVVFVECIGSYGRRTITANATVFLRLKPNAEEPDNEDSKEYLNGILKTLLGVIIVSVCINLVAFFICYKRKKRKQVRIEEPPASHVLENTCTSNHRQNRTLASTEESNMNNGNNTAIYQKDGDMCDNIIYEPYGT